jgi:carbonic anhydrase
MNFENIIEQIVRNNELFMERTGADFFADYQEKQSPIMTLVCCSDSRVQTEAIFDDSFNLVFTIRNIGNQIYSNEGSVDYGILHLKTPILMILAHTDCGAIKAFRAGYINETDSIKAELDHLIPAINKDVSELLVSVIDNLDYQVNIALEKYEEQISQNSLLVVGAIYDFKNEFKGGYGNLIIHSLNGVKA